MENLLTNTADVRKARKIKLFKEPMLQEIDAHTSKYVEAAELNIKQGNAISSDSEENLDGSIMSRLMGYRDAKLRKSLNPFLGEKTVSEADNLTSNEPAYTYELKLPPDFNDARLQAITELMHRYIVWGSLSDWFAQMNLKEANIYNTDDISEQINSLLYYQQIPKVTV